MVENTKQAILHSDPLLTSVDAAKYLTVSPRTLRRWRLDYPDLIPHVKMGFKSVRYRKSELDKFIEKNIVSDGSGVPGGERDK